MQKKSTKAQATKGKAKSKASREMYDEADNYQAKPTRVKLSSKFEWKTRFNKIELTDRQYEFYTKIMENDITFGYGAAGSSKTFTSCYAALKLLDKGVVDRIYITKPIQESGEKLGHLPGDIAQKTDPYIESFYGNMAKIIDEKDLGALVEQQKIVFKPLAYLRGVSLDNCIMLLDEAQNCDFRQLQLYISRMGKDTRVVITGDVSQYDISKDLVALPKYIEMVQDLDGIAVHEFDKRDIVRNSMLIKITERYEKWMDERKTTGSKKS